MPTIITHAVAPWALGLAGGSRRISRRLLAAGTIAAILPDADVIGFRLGVAYTATLGHRGATHSIAFALLIALIALIAAMLRRSLHSTPWRAAGFVGLAALSHPLLDALTDGGLGVALTWPLDARRFFFPWRPIAVSPIGGDFFSARGWPVIESELRWIWLPTAVLAFALWRWRHAHDAPAS